MVYKIQSKMLTEISLRIFLWSLFIWLEQSEPFIRQIQEDEVWKYKYPVTPSFVPSIALWFIIFLLPALFFFTETLATRKNQDPKRAFLGISLAYGLTGFTTSYLKLLVGRPRPDFYYRCFPDGKGTDYYNCQGPRKSYLDGRKSFPSGHASFSFAAMTFMCFYLKRKFNLFHSDEPKSWQLCICFLPMLVAAAVAISRTCDYHHHYEDVAAGAMLGTTISYLCFKLYFSECSE